jgi:hypothetical protein
VPTNPNELKKILKHSKEYREYKITLEDYKSYLWSIAMSLTSLELKEMRTFLQASEAELDSLMFTIDDEHIFKEAQEITHKIDSRIVAYIKTH